MKAGFEETFNEPLGIKFAADLIEMVARVKANRESAVSHAQQGQSAEDIQYFIHTSGIKEFFKHCDGNIRVFLGLSVGQYYHEGAHAASQVACLQNMREAYEQWLQSHITRNAAKVDLVKRTWPVELIVADVSQALNKIAAVEIDLTQRGQCIQLLNNPQLRDHEAYFVDKGTELECIYRSLFSPEGQHQKDVEINFELSDNPIRWGNLKQHYQDPLFIEMVNFLEALFKFSVQKLTDKRKENNKMPKDVEANYKKGVYDNWAEAVKVNDLAYVISEVVLLHYDIFNNTVLGEEERPILLYNGPCSMILGSGKNSLAEHFRDHISRLNCTYLRSEKMAHGERKQDKNADLFLGKLTSQCTRMLPSMSERRSCLSFIEAEIDTARALAITLEAMNSRLKRKEEKARREAKRKRENFDTSPYAQFLDGFSADLSQYSALIKQIVSARELCWDTVDPIKAMINYFSVLLTIDENSDSPRLLRSRSLTGSKEGLCSSNAEHLKMKLERLHEKFCANNAEGKRVQYLRRAGCHLVECAVAVQKSTGGQSLQLKRTKSLLLSGPEPHQSACAVAPVVIIRPTQQERLMGGLLFFIHQLTELPQIPLSALKNPDYYPDNTPRIDYVSTQESLSGSAPVSSSLGH